MAKKVDIPQPEFDPLVTLKDEARKSIEDMGDELDRALQDLEAYEELGIDQSRLRERLEWAQKAREIILTRTK